MLPKGGPGVRPRFHRALRDGRTAVRVGSRRAGKALAAGAAGIIRHGRTVAMLKGSETGLSEVGRIDRHTRLLGVGCAMRRSCG